MSRGDRDVGLVLAGQCVDRGDDGLGPVLVDEFDEILQITACGIVIRVLLQLSPGGEENELGVGGAAALFEVPCRQRQRDAVA